VRPRVGERPDQAGELGDPSLASRAAAAAAPRPASAERDVQEMEVLPVDDRGVLRELVEAGLVRAPVIPARPALGQALQRPPAACRSWCRAPVTSSGQRVTASRAVRSSRSSLRDLDAERRDLL